MSAPEPAAAANGPAGVELRACELDAVELTALRGQTRELVTLARQRGAELPAMGRVAIASHRLTLRVRPDRWLLLTPPAAPGATAGEWHAAVAGLGVVTDLSSSLTALHLMGVATREVLVRGCRLDLDPNVFQHAHAAATMMAQVNVILMRLGAGMLLLTPATTGQHFSEWLISAGRPFGLVPRESVSFPELCEERLR
ncbi:MAG: sarcosine oxidase subunit gamma family protein [Gammaproteobacteria bacterium]